MIHLLGSISRGAQMVLAEVKATNPVGIFDNWCSQFRRSMLLWQKVYMAVCKNCFAFTFSWKDRWATLGRPMWISWISNSWKKNYSISLTQVSESCKTICGSMQNSLVGYGSLVVTWEGIIGLSERAIGYNSSCCYLEILSLRWWFDCSNWSS